MKFSEKALKEFEWIVSRYPQKEAALLPALRLLEREYGSISEEGMKYIAQLLGIPPAKVFGVITFYTHYHRDHEGKYIVQVCSTLPCALKNSEALFDHLSEKLGVGNNETTADRLFTLKKVECLAACDHAPYMQINDEDYAEVTEEKIDKILDSLAKKK
jgi:NADH-quinone oxidoreductase E subunit